MADGCDPTLQNLLDQESLKWIFVGGKGGVGKTTTSCSLAIQLAAVRRNVLLISTDPAHNLSDAFRQKFGPAPVKVDGFDNLFAMEIDPEAGLAVATQAAEEQGQAGGMLKDMMGSLPGIDEMSSFVEMIKLVKNLDFAVTVFDTAPTGHTLRLLGMPETMGRALGKMAGLKSQFGGLLGQLTRSFGLGGGDGAAGDPFARLGEMHEIVQEVGRLFRDPAKTTFVCVLTAEFLPLYETERLVQELARLEIDTHNLVINQLIDPAQADACAVCKTRMAMQRKYLTQIEDLYLDFNIVKMPIHAGEIRGVDVLRPFSRDLLDPTFGRRLLATYAAASNADE